MAKGSKETGESLNLKVLEAVKESAKIEGYLQVSVANLNYTVDLRTGKVYRDDDGVLKEQKQTVFGAGHCKVRNVPVHVLVALCGMFYAGTLEQSAPALEQLIKLNKFAVCHSDGDGTNNALNNLEISDEFHNEKNRALVYGLQQWFPGVYTRTVKPRGCDYTLLVTKGQYITVCDIDAFMSKYGFTHLGIEVNTTDYDTTVRFIKFMNSRRPDEWPLADGLEPEVIKKRSYSRRVKNPSAEMIAISNFWKANKLFRSQKEFADAAEITETTLSNWLSGQLNLRHQKKQAATLWHVLYLRCKELGVEFHPDGKTDDELSDITGEAY